MEILTLVGILLSFVIIIFNFLLHGSSIAFLFNLPALSIVFGGSLAAIFVQTPMSTLIRSYYLVLWIFFPPDLNFEKLVTQVSRWTQIIRKNGIIKIENQYNLIQDPFIKIGFDLLLKGSKKETITDVLEHQIDTLESRDINAAKVFESMGGYSPTFGILAAVMGLIQAMQKLSDPLHLGEGIALAFVATIYGLSFANFFLIPIANKLKLYIYHRSRFYEMYIAGLCALINGDHPEVVETKMRSYISSL